MIYTQHGGDIEGFKKKYNGDFMDFSANLNPLGMPKSIQNAAIDAVNQSENYPDPLCRKLTSDMSSYMNVPSDYLVFGNGAADVLFRLVVLLKPKRALLLAPTFGEYEQALKSIGCHIDFYYLNEQNGFELDENFLGVINSSYDMIFICEPNNPTGVVTPYSLINEIAEKCKKHDILLFIDECFNEFVSEKNKNSLLPKLKDNKNIFILGSFTKMYCMAGIRLGYGLCSNENIVQSIKETGQPWSVSTIAQMSGIAALKETEYVKKSFEYIKTQRKFLKQNLSDMGIKVYKSQANYIFFYCDTPNLWEKLADQGIFIRDCSNYNGLTKGYYRIAVRTEEQNICLINTLKQILHNVEEK